MTPSVLAPGGSGTVTATFTNTGNSTLTHVVVNVTLAGGTFASSGSSPSCAAAAGGASCSLGDVAKGGVVTSTIAFTSVVGNGPFEFDGTATWNAASVGDPKGAAAANDTTTASTSAGSVIPTGSTLLAVNSGCPPPGGTVGASAGTEGVDTQASTPPDGLGCTPIVDGVVTDPSGGADILFTKLPATPEPVHVTLTFADDNLPSVPDFEYFDPDHPAQLAEYPNFPALSTSVTVPVCTIVNDEPTIPEGSDSCITAVTPAPDEDDDGFSDVGTIDLLVQSSGNDPGYH